MNNEMGQQIKFDSFGVRLALLSGTETVCIYSIV